MRKYILGLVLLMVIVLSGCRQSDEIKLQLNAGNDTVEINTYWMDAGAVLLGVDDLVFVSSEDTVDISILGEYTVTYTTIYEETEYYIVRKVIVLDQTAPVLSLLEGVDTIQENDSWIDGGCEVTDNSLEVLSCSTASVVDTTTAGIYEVVYTSEDSSGNEGTITRFVTVVE